MRSENSFRFQLSPSKYKDFGSSSPNANRMVVRVRIDPRTTALPREILANGNMRRSKRDYDTLVLSLSLTCRTVDASGVCKYLKTQRFVEWHRQARKHESIQPGIRFKNRLRESPLTIGTLSVGPIRHRIRFWAGRRRSVYDQSTRKSLLTNGLRSSDNFGTGVGGLNPSAPTSSHFSRSSCWLRWAVCDLPSDVSPFRRVSEDTCHTIVRTIE